MAVQKREQAERAVFFDARTSLGTASFSSTPPRFDAQPYLRETLDRLQTLGIRVGILSDPGDEGEERWRQLLDGSGLAKYFDANLTIYRKADSPSVFREAAVVAGLDPVHDGAPLLFVSGNRDELGYAAEAGFRVARDPSYVERAFSADVAVFRPDITNLAAAVDDVRQAALDPDTGPADPIDYQPLLGRLEAARGKLPPLYRENVYNPYTQQLGVIGATGFGKVLQRDPRRTGAALVMLDIAHAILQNGEAFAEQSTDAFQEVVADLYDGFLSAQDRSGIKTPDRAVIPPLVKWGNPSFGPYTLPLDATAEAFKLGAGIVSLPPSNARRGLLGWAALGHETAGHDILHADVGLQHELSQLVADELTTAKLGLGLADYWSSRIDETASDVMGILNMGPSAAIGLLGLLRGFVGAFTGTMRLRTAGPAADPHPADALRGLLAAAAVRQLDFDGAEAWAVAITRETMADITASATPQTLNLAGFHVPIETARQSAEVVARVLTRVKAQTLNNHALIEIQDWRNRDEEIVGRLRLTLTSLVPVPPEFASGIFAAHVVAAAVRASLETNANIGLLFGRMVSTLKVMHDANDAWGPLFIVHPSSIARHLMFLPQNAAD